MDSGVANSAYYESVKDLIKSRLTSDLESGQIVGAASELMGEGRLKIMENFSDELTRIKEWIEFLKVCKHYLEARKGPAEAKPRGGFIIRRTLTPLEEALAVVESEITQAGFELRRTERELRRTERDY